MYQHDDYIPMSRTEVGIDLISTAGGMASSFVNAFVTPWNAMAQYAANSQNRQLLPEANQLIGMYYAGKLSRQGLVRWVSSHGIALTQGNDISEESQLWDRVIQVGTPRLPLNVARSLFIRGDITLQEWSEQISLSGYARTPLARFIANPNLQLDVAAAQICWQRDIISQTQWRQALDSAGFTDARERFALAKMQLRIPSPAELAIGLNSGFADNNLAARFGLDEARTLDWDLWCRRLGVGWSASDLAPLVPGQVDVNWSDLLWRTTRTPLGLGYALDASIRMREDPANPGQSVMPGYRAFTLDDLDGQLRLAGYPDKYRQIIIGLRFAPISIRHIRLLYSSKAISDEELVQLLINTNIRPEDAQRLLVAYQNAEWEKTQAKGQAQLRSSILAAYKMGTIDRNNAGLGLYVSQIDTPKELFDFNQYNPAHQYAIALADSGVVMELQAVEADIVMYKAKEGISAIRKAYITGAISVDQVRPALLTLGITATRTEDYIARWKVSAIERYKFAAVGTVVKWYIDGYIDLSEVTARLHNLGYGTKDANLMIVAAQAKVTENIAKAATQTAKQMQKQLKSQEQQALALTKLARQQIARLMKDASIAKLEKYYKDCLIDGATFTQELTLRGIDPIYIGVRMKDIDNSRKGDCGPIPNVKDLEDYEGTSQDGSKPK